MIKQKFFRHGLIMATVALLGVFGFVSCDDKENVGTDPVIEPENEFETGVVKNYSYEIPFVVDVDEDVEWVAIVEFNKADGEPAYVYPNKGKGKTNVQLCVLDNDKKTLRSFIVKVFSLPDSQLIKEYPLKQAASMLSLDPSASSASGRKARGIGYGYNAFNGYASARCITKPVLRVAQMEEEEDLIYNTSTMTVNMREESGSCLTELERNLNTSISVSGEYNGFSAEMEANFSASQKSNVSNEYAWMDVSIVAARASVEKTVARMRRELNDDDEPKYMTLDAYEDINNVYEDYDDGPQGFLELVKEYGTHVIVGGVLGGKLHYQMTANTEEITGTYEASAMLRAAYSNSWVEAEASISADMQQTMTNNSSAFEFKGTAFGGGNEAKRAIIDMIEQKKGDESVCSEWSKTFVPADESEEALATAVNNMVLLDFDSEGMLVPIYEFVDKNLYPARYEDFKEYFEGQMMEDLKNEGLSSYVSIPPTMITIPTEWDENESLVKDVFTENGNHVARICNEFIPELSTTQRVTVVYPVVNNNVRYNLGYYVGGDHMYPAKVSWKGISSPTAGGAAEGAASFAKAVCSSDVEPGYGFRQTIYLRGNHLSAYQDENFQLGEYIRTEQQDFELGYSDINGGIKVDVTVPTVKIFGNIYTRDLYSGTAFRDGFKYLDSEKWGMWEHNGITYYAVREYSVNYKFHGGFTPSGWDVPYVYQITDICNAIEAIDNITDRCEVWTRRGVLGLNLPIAGYCYHNSTTTSDHSPFVAKGETGRIGLRDNRDYGFWDNVNTYKYGNKTFTSHAQLVLTPATKSALVMYYPQYDGSWDRDEELNQRGNLRSFSLILGQEVISKR